MNQFTYANLTTLTGKSDRTIRRWTLDYCKDAEIDPNNFGAIEGKTKLFSREEAAHILKQGGLNPDSLLPTPVETSTGAEMPQVEVERTEDGFHYPNQVAGVLTTTVKHDSGLSLFDTETQTVAYDVQQIKRLRQGLQQKALQHIELASLETQESQEYIQELSGAIKDAKIGMF